MSYGIFLADNAHAEFTQFDSRFQPFANKTSADEALAKYRFDHFHPDDYDLVYVARICFKHEELRDDQGCECWFDGDYEDQRFIDYRRP